jgi:hypothetical protein
MSDLRIKGDLSKLPKPQKGLNKRVLAKSTSHRTCPQCGQQKPFDQFFFLSHVSHERGLPTATLNRGGRCNSCKSRPRGGKKRALARVRVN